MLGPRNLAIGLVIATGATGAVAAAGPDSLTLSVGGEVTEFEITHCRTDPYTSEGATTEAEFTSVGTFRGQPAALLVRKVTGDLDGIELYLTELSPERRAMPPRAVMLAIAAEFEEANLAGTAAIMEDYSPEKMKDVSPEERIAKTKEMMARLDELEDELAPLRVPIATSNGSMTIDGSRISFEGREFVHVGGEPADAFADLSGAVRVEGECSL